MHATVLHGDICNGTVKRHWTSSLNLRLKHHSGQKEDSGSISPLILCSLLSIPFSLLGVIRSLLHLHYTVTLHIITVTWTMAPSFHCSLLLCLITSQLHYITGPLLPIITVIMESLLHIITRPTIDCQSLPLLTVIMESIITRSIIGKNRFIIMYTDLRKLGMKWTPTIQHQLSHLQHGEFPHGYADASKECRWLPSSTSQAWRGMSTSWMNDCSSLCWIRPLQFDHY